MPNYDKLKRTLKEFSATKPPEILVKDLEKRLMKPLNIERLPDKSGSSVIYYHPAVEEIKEGGIFLAHRIHGRKQETITKHDFKRYLLYAVEAVIEYEERHDSGNE